MRATRVSRVPVATLFGGVAFGTTAFVASVTVAPLVAAELAGSPTWSGLPWAAGVFGTGIGATVLSRVMAATDRRHGLVVGYVTATGGAALAVIATVAGVLVALVAAMLVMGLGNAANHLSRYAAADVSSPDRRASGLGLVVWAGTVGGVAGPALLGPSGRLGERIGVGELAGPFLLAGAALAAAALLASTLRITRVRSETPPVPPARWLASWSHPRAQLALVALATGQVVMILLMSMTPVHIRSHGQPLGIVGLVIGAHVFGMYGLSPVAGWLTDRLGSLRVIVGGFGLLALAALGAAATPAGVALAGPLFLLGLGWSLTFVAGSALLTEGMAYEEAARLQGATDTVVWTSAGLASLGSGVVLGVAGYAALSLLGAGLVLLALTVLASRRRGSVAPA